MPEPVSTHSQSSLRFPAWYPVTTPGGGSNGMSGLEDLKFVRRDPSIVCDVHGNRERWLDLNGRDKPSEEYREYAQNCVAVHGTSVERALGILKSNSILSHRALETSDDPAHRDVANKRLQNQTDVLDRELGLDEFVFLNVGRVHLIDVHEVYFCFPNTIVDRPESLVALREIVHFGALVSPEALRFRERALNQQIDVVQRNTAAARDFFENVFLGRDFATEIFPRFLASNYPRLDDFVKGVQFPGTEPQLLCVGNESTILNAWEGPQLTVAEQVRFCDVKPVIVVTTPKADVRRELRKYGSSFEVIFLTDHLQNMRKSAPWLPEFSSLFAKSLYMNLALNELSLLGRFNRSGVTHKDELTFFKKIC